MSDEIKNKEIEDKEIENQAEKEDVKSIEPEEGTLEKKEIPEEVVAEEESSAKETIADEEGSEEEKSPAIEEREKEDSSSKDSAQEEKENTKAEEKIEENKTEISDDKTSKAEEKAETKKGKKISKIKKVKKLRVNVGQSYEKIQTSVPALIVTCIVAFTIMIALACAVFFASVKGPEQVLVPNVIGSKLEDALLEMQVKELYPRINLRYSNNPEDKGTILEQDPEAGTIVKGYSRVSLVVSRGVVVDSIGDYVGKNLDEVQMSLQTLFAGQLNPLISLATPKYIPDTSDPGTILEQDPPEGFKISSPISVQLVVSRGPNYENTRRPYVIGQNVNDLLQTIARSKIVFDITSHDASDDEKPGTVTSQESIDTEFVPNYTRVAIEMALPATSTDENVYGIFQETLNDYPYPIAMRLEAIPNEGNAYTILNFNHPGGNLTIPYAVPKGTTLVLYVAEKAKTKKLVE
ncbi:MAG: PASTA domain-containing protein [Treponema sp.]|nr:PASTA domain-containing protein [Treponema sp.]